MNWTHQFLIHDWINSINFLSESFYYSIGSIYAVRAREGLERTLPARWSSHVSHLLHFVLANSQDLGVSKRLRGLTTSEMIKADLIFQPWWICVLAAAWSYWPMLRMYPAVFTWWQAARLVILQLGQTLQYYSHQDRINQSEHPLHSLGIHLKF